MTTCPIRVGDVAGYESCIAPPMGLYSYPGISVSTDINSLYALVSQRNAPPGVEKSFATFCEASLRARGLLYYKSSVGDCGSAVGSPTAGINSGQIAGLTGTAASGVIGGLGAAGALSGPATLGIGSAVSLAIAGIADIFTHHAQAVANEQRTICAVANYFNPLVRQIDQAVMRGSITADQGLVFIRQVAQQAINGLGSIVKNSPCNAACQFIGVLKAHIDFAASFYPLIAPYASIGNAPGSAPSFFGTPPGGVADTFGGPPPPPIRSLPWNTYAPAGPDPNAPMADPLTQNTLLPSGCRVSAPSSGAIQWIGGAACSSDYLNIGYRQPTGQEGQYADVPPTGIDWVMIGAIAAVIAAFVALLAVLR